MPKVLLVDDDLELTQVVRTWLLCNAYVVEVAHDGQQATECLRFNKYDVVLLDWSLPDMSGLDILKAYRNEGGLTPVIMLTGRRSVDDRTTGLDEGADDYVTKPFHMKELAARIRTVMRRQSPIPSNILRGSSITLDPVKHRVYKNDKSVSLLPKEFALLEFFMRNPDVVFSADAILLRVWHSDSEATLDAVRTTIKRLRQKLDGDSEQSSIETIPRVGYRFRG